MLNFEVGWGKTALSCAVGKWMPRDYRGGHCAASQPRVERRWETEKDSHGRWRPMFLHKGVASFLLSRMIRNRQIDLSELYDLVE